jgi:ribosomal 50S subunit-recycling heat shock protein
MRLDLFLKLSRVCPRRSIAQKLCEAGLVLLNQRPVKPAHAIKAGDTIAVRRPDRETEFRVLIVPEARNVSKREAKDLIEVIAEKRFEPVDL